MTSSQTLATTEEQVRQVFQNIKNGWVGLFVLLFFITYIAGVHHTDIQTWGIVAALVAVGHGVLIHTFIHRDKNRTIRSYQQWGRAIALYSLFAGAIISIGASLAFDEDSVGWNYFLIALVIMPGFGSAVTSTSFLSVHVGWVLGTNLPLALFLLMQESEIPFAMGLLILFTAIPVMLLIGVGYARMYNRNIALRLENISLMDDLKIEADAAIQANRDKSRFLAAASHDLRQPHQALGLFLESLDYLESEPGKKEILNKTKQAFRAMSSLLDQLLDISKLDAGSISAEMQPIKLQPLLHRTVMEQMTQADRKGIELRLRSTPATVYADPAMLIRIVSNLLANAIRYTKSGGVLLSVCRRSERWRIDVWDTGCGIAEDKIASVFQEFTQIENPERDREKGLGLGLFIVERLSNMMGAEISVRSRLGKGSRFSITLSAADEKEIMKTEPVATIDITQLQALTVVIIDDDRIARDGLNMLLNVWGCHVLSFTSQQECLDSLNHSGISPDVLIVDYRLRENRTGVEAIKAVCQSCGREIPSLIITGDTAPERIEEAKKSGVPLLHKPINPTELQLFLLHVKHEGAATVFSSQGHD